MKEIYTLDYVRETDGGCDCGIHLDPGHVIYKAHFPGEPITPGVCILQMAVKILSSALQAPLTPVRLRNVKFLQILVPGVAKDLVWRFRDIRCAEDTVDAQCTLYAGESVIAKISLTCLKS